MLQDPSPGLGGGGGVCGLERRDVLGRGGCSTAPLRSPERGAVRTGTLRTAPTPLQQQYSNKSFPSRDGRTFTSEVDRCFPCV